MKSKKRFRCLVFFVIPLLFFSCDSLPEKTVKMTENIRKKAETAKKTVETRRSSYLSKKNTGDFDFFRSYDEREHWSQWFENADQKIAVADGIFKQKIDPLLDRNKSKEAPKVHTMLNQVSIHIRSALVLSEFPEKRMAFLASVKETVPERLKKAESQMKQMDGIIESLDKFIEKARKDYPGKAAVIEAENLLAVGFRNKTRDALDIAESEGKKHSQGQTADFAIIGDNTERVSSDLAKLTEKDKKIRAWVGELYQSYSKILQDMRVDYFVVVKRESWNESSDSYNPYFFTFPPKQVSQQSYRFLTNPASPKTIATVSYGGYRNIIPDKVWKDIGINPKIRFSSYENSAELWVDDAFIRTYQKYLKVTDSGAEETDWVEVDEDDFFDQVDFLGMEIANKPFGYFEKEKIVSASPPGMAFVGDSRYGKWKTDSGTGETFWSFYGKYALLKDLIGVGIGHRYSRREWELWRTRYRGKKPYFGAVKPEEYVYGTRGSYTSTSSRYQSTNFARRGGFQSAAASVRGAGRGRRGGGPGGFGK